MKIAIVTNDEITISQHFGRAKKYAVITIEEGKIIKTEFRDKIGHQQFKIEEKNIHLAEHHHEHQPDERGRGLGKHSAEKHRRMFENIKDCDVLLARGMGRGAYIGLQETGLRPILTDIENIILAAEAVIENTIINYEDRLH